jgi:hypothetical protein
VLPWSVTERSGAFTKGRQACSNGWCPIFLFCMACFEPVLSCFLRRDRPVPIPAPGIQLVSLSHVEDLASLLASVPGNSAALKQHFNLVADRSITFDGT